MNTAQGKYIHMESTPKVPLRLIWKTSMH